MVLLAQGEALQVGDLPESVVAAGGQVRGTQLDLAGRSLAEMEEALIKANLELMEDNRERTAKVLGIGERTLYRKIKEYGLQ
jgi:two-component system response regulator HydG